MEEERVPVPPEVVAKIAELHQQATVARSKFDAFVAGVHATLGLEPGYMLDRAACEFVRIPDAEDAQGD